ASFRDRPDRGGRRRGARAGRAGLHAGAENLAVLGIWRESSRSLRDLASRTSDVVLVCDLDGAVRYASPAVEDYGYPPSALTGLPNRAYVEERARDVLRDAALAARTGVIFLDLDRFTAVNDSVGHGAGDLVLAQAARRLRAVVPVHDTVARWGSDEFAVLVEDAGSDQEVAEIADRLATVVAGEPFRVAG